jgi:acyl carrier protein
VSAGPAEPEAYDPPLLREVAAMLQEVTGEDPAWAAGITVTSRLEDDLQLDSLELTTLDAALRRRFGADVDLSGYLATLDLDQLIALTVGDLLTFLGAVTEREAAR